ncbi:acyl-CoA dehydrogenase family protein [Streptomyces sp. NPDC018031]|uniref:acyl-CoA dehydrogenase family protein n=1 Tax=Streptomyces sp. NPDC018031 TaxID=3365033 RepID=UPI0037AC3998
MTSRPLNQVNVPGTSSFLEEIFRGSLRLDLIHPFPEQPEDDRKTGDAQVAEAKEFARRLVDPTDLESARALPRAVVDELRGSPYVKLQSPVELGGLALSDLNTFRVVQAIASWSLPLGLFIAIQNSIGFAPLLRILPDGPLRAMLTERVAEGLISSFADTEPNGAANHRRETVAVPAEDGDGYLITGEKVFSGNAAFAELLGVVATVHEAERETRRLFVVDPAAPGVRRSADHEFMGIKGFPNGGFSLDRVRVPADHVFVENPSPHDVRITAQAGGLAILGRMYLIAAPSLAIAKLCLQWQREFVNRRSVDGVPLGEYEEIQHLIGESLADTFALEAVAEWSLLCEDLGLNPLAEQNAAKNLCSVLCWGVVDRTMSLYAAEGYETAESKARRGAPPVPLERAFRDARGLRISGGVDFQLDYWMSKFVIFSYHRAGVVDGGTPPEAAERARQRLAAALNVRNQRHLAQLQVWVDRFRERCAELARSHPDDAALFAQERTLIAVARLAAEVMAASLVLARAARRTAEGDTEAQDLADVYCTGALRRIADHAREADDPERPDTGRVSRKWIGGDDRDELLRDIVTETGAGTGAGAAGETAPATATGRAPDTER